MRDRLIELLDSAQFRVDGGRIMEQIADHLLAEGVIVPPCELGQGCTNCPFQDARFKTNVK